MIKPVLVCPFSKKLMDKIKYTQFIITVSSFDDITEVIRWVHKTNELMGIRIKTDKPVSSIEFHKNWAQFPLFIYADKFGDFPELFPKLETIRNLNVHLFLSAHHDFNFTGLRILSSLQICCGVWFEDIALNWDLMNDLMHYTIYSKPKHAHIEPFSWLAEHYMINGYPNYDAVYFNDPLKYLHINDSEQVALTESDLLKNNFIAEGVENIDGIQKLEQYRDLSHSRYETMLRMGDCAFCSAFRICLGKFGHLEDKENTCQPFFTDLHDACDYHHSGKTSKGNILWQ